MAAPGDPMADVVRGGDVETWLQDIDQSGSVSFRPGRNAPALAIVLMLAFLATGLTLLISWWTRGHHLALLVIGLIVTAIGLVLGYVSWRFTARPEIVTISRERITSAWGLDIPLSAVRAARVAYGSGSTTLLVDGTDEQFQSFTATRTQVDRSGLHAFYTKDNTIAFGTNLAPNADLIARLITSLIERPAAEDAVFASDVVSFVDDPKFESLYHDIEDGDGRTYRTTTMIQALAVGVLAALGGVVAIIVYLVLFRHQFHDAPALLLMTLPSAAVALWGVWRLTRAQRTRGEVVHLSREGVSGPWTELIPWEDITGARSASTRYTEAVVLHLTDEGYERAVVTNDSARDVPGGTAAGYGSIGKQLAICGPVDGGTRELAALIARYAQTAPLRR